MEFKIIWGTVTHSSLYGLITGNGYFSHADYTKKHNIAIKNHTVVQNSYLNPTRRIGPDVGSRSDGTRHESQNEYQSQTDLIFCCSVDGLDRYRLQNKKRPVDTGQRFGVFTRLSNWRTGPYTPLQRTDINSVRWKGAVEHLNYYSSFAYEIICF